MLRGFPASWWPGDGGFDSVRTPARKSGPEFPHLGRLYRMGVHFLPPVLTKSSRILQPAREWVTQLSCGNSAFHQISEIYLIWRRRNYMQNAVDEDNTFVRRWLFGKMQNSLAPDLPWFALQVKPRYEKVASTVLRKKGFEEFLPVYQSRRVWSDRIAKVEVPLFPGYVFCRFDPELRRLPVVTTPGVINVVGVAGQPAAIPEHELEMIQTILRSGKAALPWPYLGVGARVRIERGALAGVEGILVEAKKQHRVVVSVTLLQRSVAVEVERDWIIPSRASNGR
jgi:transcription antitermination factor NusG